jgi:hypothetical protein
LGRPKGLPGHGESRRIVRYTHNLKFRPKIAYAFFEVTANRLIQIFEAIRHRAWLRYRVCKWVSLEKAGGEGNNFGTSALFRTRLPVKTQSFF